ncbi:hypothetical protein Syun_025567 [Stephania yunnanensis]|uniref:Uncharacterized protein n=1 Tax=Stephania yunnanensis TaxID=152371 RepID=A0AAP0EX91_9MAGN
MQSSDREVAELYGSEKSFVVEVQLALSGLRYTPLIALDRYGFVSGYHCWYEHGENGDKDPQNFYQFDNHIDDADVGGFDTTTYRKMLHNAKLQRRRLEPTQATLDQPVDDEAMYFNVAGECPKGRVCGLGFLVRKKRKYADPGASTSQMPEMVPRSEFDSVAEQLR